MSCCGAFIMPPDATMRQTQPERSARPITGRFVLASLVIFFGVVFAVNGVMMTLAIRTMPGLDAKNGYVASQAMNAELAAMRLQAERGWRADIAAQLDGGLTRVSVSLTGKDGQPLTGLEVDARFAHPAFVRADQAAALVEHRPGFYVATLAGVSPGGWTIVVEASRNGERVFASRDRIILKDGRP